MVGAPVDFENGAAYVYTRDATGVWSEEAKLLPADNRSNAFGVSVAVSGHTAVIGANRDDAKGNDSGAAYVYVRSASGVWAEQAKLVASDGVAGDLFGGAVAVSDDVVVIGATDNDDNGDQTGSAYVYTRDADGRWAEQAKLLASDGAANDHFGGAVAVSGDWTGTHRRSQRQRL